MYSISYWTYILYYIILHYLYYIILYYIILIVYIYITCIVYYFLDLYYIYIYIFRRVYIYSSFYINVNNIIYIYAISWSRFSKWILPGLRLFEVRPRFGHIGGLGVCGGLAGQLRGTGDGGPVLWEVICHGPMSIWGEYGMISLV